MKTESELTRDLVKLATKRGLLLRKHSDTFRAGVPDLSHTSCGWSSWWEVKLALGKIKWQNELQRLECLKHEIHGYCRVIVYGVARMETEHGFTMEKFTAIVRPSAIEENGAFTAEERVEGFNHEFVLAFMEQRHHIGPRWTLQ